MEFTGRRTRSLARLAAYVLLLVFLLSLLGSALPLPLGDPDRAMLLLNEVLERSPLPLIGVLALFFGFAEDAQPAIWEVMLARGLRPLLRLAALAYLLLALAVLGLADRIEANGVQLLSGQLQTSLQSLERLRRGVDQAGDAQTLQTLLAQDPRLIQAMQQAGITVGEARTFPQQQALARQLLERAEGNLRQTGQRRRADASGNLTRQSVRLVLVALCYAGFHLLASFIWPPSLALTLERAVERRQALALEQQEEAIDPSP
ncbi:MULTISPECIES: hypothetical protein [Aphanothece]|uniref:hypothetical protein n=1 Tax=Aphanothece TaxID=1121 RepID=UPI003984DD14